MRPKNSRFRPTTRGSTLLSPIWLIAGIAALISVAGILLYVWRTGSKVEDLAAWGYPGIFLLMMISGASILLSAPAQAAVVAASAVWTPWLVGISAGLGMATGELLGYTAGRAGRAVIRANANARWQLNVQEWLDRFGFFLVLVLALIPNPLFDAMGILIGSTGYSVSRFWLACAIGYSVKYVALAYLGRAALRWFT